MFNVFRNEVFLFPTLTAIVKPHKHKKCFKKQGKNEFQNFEEFQTTDGPLPGGQTLTPFHTKKETKNFRDGAPYGDTVETRRDGEKKTRKMRAASFYISLQTNMQFFIFHVSKVFVLLMLKKTNIASKKLSDKDIFLGRHIKNKTV